MIGSGPLLIVRCLTGWHLRCSARQNGQTDTTKAQFSVLELVLSITVFACFFYLARIPYVLEFATLPSDDAYMTAVLTFIVTGLITIPMVVFQFRMSNVSWSYGWNSIALPTVFFVFSSYFHSLFGDASLSVACVTTYVIFAVGFVAIRCSGICLARTVSNNSTSSRYRQRLQDSPDEGRLIVRDVPSNIQLTALVVVFTACASTITNTVQIARHNTEIMQNAHAAKIIERGGSLVFRERKAHSLKVDCNANDDDFVRFYNNCEDIWSLSLEKTQISNDTIANLGKFKNLRSLNLNGTRISDECVESICRLSGLWNLDIANTSITVDGRRRLLLGLPQLSEFNVSGLGVKDDELVELPYHKLSAIKLRCNYITDSGLTNFLAVCEKRNLQNSSYWIGNLDLYGTQVTGGGLCGRGNKIGRLVLGGPQVTDVAIARAASRFEVGHHLELLDTMLTNDSIPHLFRILKVGSLVIGDCLITDQGIASAAMPCSEIQLTLSGKQFTGNCFQSWNSELKCLSMRGSSVSDETVQFVSTQENLHYLSLADTNISDGGIAHLKKLRHLRWLDLSDTHVTPRTLIDLLPTGMQINLSRDQFTKEQLRLLSVYFKISFGEPIPWH